MTYIGVKFTSKEKPFEAKGQTYYYKTSLEFEANVAYNIYAGTYCYNNPVIVVEKTNKAPDPSRVYKEITEARPVAYMPRTLKPWIIPKKVYFNPDNGGVTCVIWEDGEKTLVRCCEEDIFDFEKGFAMAVLSRLYGKGELNKLIKKFIRPAEEKYDEEFRAKCAVLCAIDEMGFNFRENENEPINSIDDVFRRMVEKLFEEAEENEDEE